MPPDLNADPLLPALERCAAEPIHIPGGVQPFAVLLAVRDDGTVTRCSANAAAILGRGPDDVVGRPLSEVLPRDADRIARTFDGLPAERVETLDRVATCSGELTACLHHYLGERLVELISPWGGLPVGPPLLDNGAALAVEGLAGLINEGTDTETYCRAVAERFRELTGYDRVMVYRFDGDWNGAVIAEARAEGVGGYLGQNFPASDIPPQARALYHRTPVRVLADAEADPVPLLPAGAPPLDLSFAVSRAMSPIHREYLHNMGARGTLVASVIRDGRLWGMIACHHVTPLLPPRSWLPLIGAFARLIAVQVAVQEGGSRSRAVTSAQSLLRMLPRLLSEYGRLGDGLIDPRTGLMEVLNASGMAVRHGGEWFTRGTTPGPADLAALATWLAGHGPGTFVTDRLGEAAPAFAHLSGSAPGVLAMQVPNTADGWILWFRGEHSTAVTWAGDYRKGLDVGVGFPRLGPRKSFRSWVAEVRGRSRPWTHAELTIADGVIRPNLLEVMATAYQQQSQQLRRYQHILFEQVHDAVIVTDLTGVVTFWNDGAQRTLGWRTEEMVGRHIAERVSASERHRAADLLRAIRTGGTFSGRFRDSHKDGRPVWLDLRLRRIRDEAGREIGIMAAARDVTGEKFTEDRLRLKRAIVRHSRDAVLVTGADSPDLPALRVVYVNPAFLAETGYAEAEVLDEPLTAFLGPHLDTDSVVRIGDSLRQWEPCRAEAVVPRKDGSTFWAETDFVPLPDDEGGHSHWIVVLRNITDRKAAEATLRASEELFRSAFESSGIGMSIVGLDGRFLRVNPALAEMLGREPGEFTGSTHGAHTHPEDLGADLLLAAEAVAGQRSTYELEQRYRAADGRVVWVILTAALIRDGGGNPVHFIRQVQDVTDRRRAEDALRASEERLRAITDNLPDGTIYRYVRDPLGGARFVYIGEGIERLLGVPAADVLASPWAFAARTFPEDRARVELAEAVSLRDLSTFNCEFRVRTLAGESRWLQCRAAVHRTPDGLVVWDGVVMDVTFRKEAESRLAEREQFLTALFEGSPIGIEVFAPDGTTLRMNSALQALIGFPTRDYAVGRYNVLTDPLLRDGPVPDAFRRALSGDVATLGEYPLDLTSPENTWATARRLMWLDCTFFAIRNESGVVERVVMFVLDATPRVTARAEKEILEHATQQAQKLDAIGQLAGGIAHDFNNILTGVRVFADLILDDLEPGEAGREAADEIRKAADRGANLTRRLLSFSRKQVVQPTTLDVSALVLDMCEMFRRLLGDDVTVSTELAPDAPPVLADKGQLEQIVLNLVLNARDAMPTGGRVVIAAARACNGNLPLVARGEATAREYLLLSVRDTGTGMTDEVRARLFEPFFTTKPVGRGTGLGLATTYGIVRQAGGFITVETEVGRGTAFHVYLPATGAAVATREVAGVGFEAGHVPGAGILVVDDDATIRRLALLVLERAGYRVVTAGGAGEAIDLCESAAEGFDLLLTDVVMPGLSGRELAERLAPRHPGLKVAYLSGYTPDTVLLHGVREDGVAFLHKPFSEEQLLRFVGRCLAGDPRS